MTLDWSKLKVYADDKMNVNEKLKFVFGRVENILGKGTCWLLAFSLFPNKFSKGFFYMVVTCPDNLVNMVQKIPMNAFFLKFHKCEYLAFFL